MKGSSTLSVAIQLLLVAFIANISQVKCLTPEQTCPLVQNNTYIADPKDCQGWALCRNGKPIYGKCNDNLYYDSTSGVCDYQQNVACNTNVQTMCSGLTDVYKADPNDCSKYLYCHEGATYSAFCPPGQNYDAQTVSCVWAASSNCLANNPCLLVQNGFMGDGKTCSGYIRCGSSQVVVQGQCPSGRYYNPNNGLCDYPENVKCSTSPPVPVVPTNPPAPAGLCKKEKTFYGDGATCQGYFYCPTANGDPQWGRCPKNSQFNEAKQECNDPDQIACATDRCDGVTKKFMAVANTKCKQYYNCNNGVSTGKGSCPDEYPYFNEVGGVCQAKPLEAPICA